MHDEEFNVEEINECVKIMAVDAAEVIKKSKEMCHQKATEMLIFMLSDTDRLKGESMESYTHPAGYILKGPSLPVSEMRNIINHLQNVLKQSGVDVICETSEGQWANMCFECADGFPLTLLHLQKRSWTAANNLSRKGVLNKLFDVSGITKDDLLCISETEYEPGQCSIIGNATIFMSYAKNQCKLSVASNEGHVKFCGLLRHIDWSNIDIMQEEVLKSQVSSRKPPKNTGLLNSDINILTTLPDDLIQDLAMDMANADPCYWNLDDALTSDKFNILEDICNTLKNIDEKRWENMTCNDLFPGILASKKEMNARMCIVELNPIADQIKSYTDHIIFPWQHSKYKKINVIVQLFGSNDFFDEVPKNRNKALLLKKLAMDIVEKQELLGLQVAYVKAVHEKIQQHGNQKLLSL